MGRFRTENRQALPVAPITGEFCKRVPPIPLRYTPTRRGLVALNLTLFCLNGCLVPMDHSVLVPSTLWQAGYLSMIELPARFAMEAEAGWPM